MSPFILIAWFFAGLLLANAVPHLISGMCGRAFQSPFATPHGVGLSSATVNVVWGFGNLLAGYLLLVRVGAFDPREVVDMLAGNADFSPSLFLSRSLWGLRPWLRNALPFVGPMQRIARLGRRQRHFGRRLVHRQLGPVAPFRAGDV